MGAAKTKCPHCGNYVVEQCTRCGHEWTPLVKKPVRCPNCLSQYWDKKKKLHYDHWKTREKREREARQKKIGLQEDTKTVKGLQNVDFDDDDF